MFTTIHGHMLADYDVILFDDGIHPFAVESYITRDAAKERQNNRKPASRRPRIFKNFAHLYEKGNFVRHAERTEYMINLANQQLLRWRNHLRNDGGLSLIRIKDLNTS